MGNDMWLNPLDDNALEDISLERQFVNVLDRQSDPYHVSVFDTYGVDRIFYNGYRRRTRHEINTAISTYQQQGIEIDAEIINLPYTVLNLRGKPAETAFTDKNTNHRHIYLVPDHTPTRILNDKAFHGSGLETLLKTQQISQVVFDRWNTAMNNLDIGNRVAYSINHEYGHILTYRAMDESGIETPLQVYDWLGDLGYLDNCSHRIVQFNNGAAWQIHVALEQLAEDYRLSHFVQNEQSACSLPSCLSYQQDIVNPEKYLEGVEIMTKLLDIQDKLRKKQQKSSLESILPFGEANRSDSAMEYFSLGVITPITEENKKKAREELLKLFP
ncbi:hypothetical protein [Paenibacillus sp. SN-8-1]|uniref:hypothetical protein n=1 Tax=Paenibacillus sp. SN-8-1 TaxID=3435409 RepID=UPI003D9A849D